MLWLTCRACKSVLTGHCFLVRMLWYEFYTFSLHLHFMTRFMLSPSCFIITQSAHVIISYCTTLHLFCTFRIGRLYKPCFSAKQKARRSCPAGGASPGGSEFADVQLGGCHMSALGFSATTAHPGTLAGHHEFSSHHCTDAKGQMLIAFVRFCRCFRQHDCIKTPLFKLPSLLNDYKYIYIYPYIPLS